MPADAAQRIVDLLDRALPAPRRGTRILDRALAHAGLSALPVTTEELKSFVRTSVRATLEDELGPRLANEVANDLDAALSPALRRCETLPASPSSRRMRRVGVQLAVLVVGADRVRNAGVARILIRAGYSVTTAHDLVELAMATAAPTDAIVLDERSAIDPPEGLVSLLDQRLAVVHSCSNPPLAESLLRERGVAGVAAIREGAASGEVLTALTSLAAV